MIDELAASTQLRKLLAEGIARGNRLPRQRRIQWTSLTRDSSLSGMLIA